MKIFDEYFTARCSRCRWAFRCHRERSDRIYCRACESIVLAEIDGRDQ